jgi:nucleoside phosphorylase
MHRQSRNEFEIAIICTLPLEADAVETLFDEHYDELGHVYGKQAGDLNAYLTGRISGHHVVLAYMPTMGNRSAATVARGLQVSFTGIKLALVVGICGGVPFSSDRTELILGDVIISDSVIEYDFGRQYPDGFQRRSDVKETLGQSNQEIRALLNHLRTHRTRNRVQEQISQHLEYIREHKGSDWNYPGTTHDVLFEASYCHKHYQPSSVAKCICTDCKSSQDSVCEQALRSDCKAIGCTGELVQRCRLGADSPEPLVHIGTIASANTVMNSGERRDRLAEKEGVIGFEMEGDGVWNNLPCVIIKGACDYADSHKNKMWQNYAAATAASCTKAFLEYWTTQKCK